ncbi:MAG: hypothetical protein QOI31_1733 [Solirubrobacterales bacterium]|nr:hypothetical protein [Solirubrobacterales bacterium]
MIAAFGALSSDEQGEAFKRIGSLRLDRLASEESEMARHLRSLQRVTAHLGEKPNSTSYRRAWRELRDAGETEIISLGSQLRFFGSWTRAADCLDMTEASSVDRIRHRIGNRQLGRVHQYSKATMRHWVEEAVSDLGLAGDERGRDRRAPQCREFLEWRRERRRLAEAQGQILHIPTAAPYRRLTSQGTWAAAMRVLGFTVEEVNARFDCDQGTPRGRSARAE